MPQPWSWLAEGRGDSRVPEECWRGADWQQAVQRRELGPVMRPGLLAL